jgi:hypothetical protein
LRIKRNSGTKIKHVMKHKICNQFSNNRNARIVNYANFKTSLTALLVSALSLSSCDKAADPQVYDPSAAPVTVGVLQNNTSYTGVFDTAIYLGGANGSPSNIGIYDFTIENGNMLHAVMYTSLPTQQSPLVIPARFSRDLNTGKSIALPSGIGQYPQNLNVSYDKVIRQFFPYSNIYAILVEKNGMGQFLGDIDATINTGIGNPQGQGDFSFRYPVFNSGGFYGNFSRLSSGDPGIGSSFTVFRAGIGSNANLNYFRVSCLHEVYDNNGTKDYFAIGVTADSVQVYKINFSFMGDNNNYPVFTAEMIQALPTTVNGTLEERSLRHYSTDGRTLSFMITEMNTNKRSTYVYNFANNTLTQNLSNVVLEYADAGSDIDIDEAGDLYYTGYAGNGSNTGGVSVYKKSGSAAAVLVGSDNFLKFGTVVRLKVLMGKVYLAVTGKQSDKDVYQLTMLRQN